MTPAMTDVTVTQADRERASATYRKLLGASEVDYAGIIAGVHDNYQFVQAFARHRIAAAKDAIESSDIGPRNYVEGYRRGIKEAARAATSFLVGDPANNVPLRNPSPHEIADAIRDLQRLGQEFDNSPSAASSQGEG